MFFLFYLFIIFNGNDLFGGQKYNKGPK
jgi:hypothetical protein